MPRPPQLRLEQQEMRAGLRLGIAVSGGADSVALLRALAARQADLGLVLSVIHVDHGIRGEEADRDRQFVEELAVTHGLPFLWRQVDTPARVREHGETLEEAGRILRYEFFHHLLQSVPLDAVATAHTLDDQAETVLQKLLRGAWTEGLGGISPLVSAEGGTILRPLLETTRAEVEAYLHLLGQSWCEDATNSDTAHTRNRIRHELLPHLRGYNPQISAQLGRTAAIARDEEDYWSREVTKIAPALVLPGKPVRGGGRSSSTHPDEASIALELERLRAFPVAVQRRLLRWFAQKVGCSLDFDMTENLLALAGRGQPARRLEINREVYVQRTARELQFVRTAAAPTSLSSSPDAAPAAPLCVPLPVPGQVDVPEIGLSFTVTLNADATPGKPRPPALARYNRPGDRITLRHARGPKSLKEIFERARLPAADRQWTPVVVWPASDPKAPIVWLRGIELDPASLPDLPFTLSVAALGGE